MSRSRKKRSSRSSRRQKVTFKDYLNNLFLPGRKNRYRPQLLHPETLILVSLVVLAFFALFNALRFFPSLADKILGFATNIDVNQVLTSTNEERARLGLAPLQINEKLSQAAVAKAQHMFSEQYWAHTSPDGMQPWIFIKNTGYTYKYAGENLARDFDSTEKMMEAWLNSPTHKENIINPNFTQIGLAVLNGTLHGFNTTLVVQMFAAPGAVESNQSVVHESSTSPLVANSSVGELPEEDLNINIVDVSNAMESDLAGVEELGLVEGERSVSGRILFSPIYLTRTFFLLVVVLIILTLMYDTFVSNNRRYARIVGQNFAHIMLFLTVGFLLILFRGGTIIP